MDCLFSAEEMVKSNASGVSKSKDTARIAAMGNSTVTEVQIRQEIQAYVDPFFKITIYQLKGLPKAQCTGVEWDLLKVRDGGMHTDKELTDTWIQPQSSVNVQVEIFHLSHILVATY